MMRAHGPVTAVILAGIMGERTEQQILPFYIDLDFTWAPEIQDRPKRSQIKDLEIRRAMDFVL
jgi:hypothetical protein